MSTARWGKKWADVDEEEDEGLAQSQSDQPTRFESKADEHGIKTVVEYTERDGKTFKVTKRVKQTTVTKWTNTQMAERKQMKKFGKPAQNEEANERSLIVRSEEEVPIELSKKNVVSITTKDDAEDKFFEESLNITESLFKEKKAWADANRDKHIERETAAAPEPAAATAAAASSATPTPGKYMPPSLRGGAAGGKGGGKGDDGKGGQQQEASLRVTNLSEDVRDGDLQDLFGQFGRLQRVFLSKDPNTALSKGFAFITYYTREDAQKAIDKLNGHGYDNLILQVQWAKPRA